MKNIERTDNNTNNIKASVVVPGGKNSDFSVLRSVEMFNWSKKRGHHCNQ